MFSNQVTSKFPKARDDRVSNTKSEKGRATRSQSKKPTSANCGKIHRGECLVCTENCFVCTKSGHKVRDCPNFKGQYKGSGKLK